MNILDAFEEIVIDDTYDSDYTLDEAKLLIEDAKSRGFTVPNKLTPELYIKLYNSHKKFRSQEYLMAICEDFAENCIVDDIRSVKDAKEYLTTMKLEGYTVPSMLTPKLFLKLYKKYSD